MKTSEIYTTAHTTPYAQAHHLPFVQELVRRGRGGRWRKRTMVWVKNPIVYMESQTGVEHGAFVRRERLAIVFPDLVVEE